MPEPVRGGSFETGGPREKLLLPTSGWRENTSAEGVLVSLRGAVMRKALLVVLSVLLVACSKGDDSASDPRGASTTGQRGEPLVIRTRIDIADKPGAEVIATGQFCRDPPWADRRSALAGPSWTPMEAPTLRCS